ncbi:MAG TPA: flagellar type III secretion system protein FlhB, partial [Pseudomonadales bacterium]|nr:flagellar type III secretion system protein FlhB [Pseudomonadales bacterium]
MGPYLMTRLSQIFHFNFVLRREELFDEHEMVTHFNISVYDMFIAISPFFAVAAVTAFASPLLLGGWLFSTDAFMPNFGRMNPASGIKRMFSSHGLSELLKALAKFSLLSGITIYTILKFAPEMMHLSAESMEGALIHGSRLLGIAFISLCASLGVIALFDVPYQLWNFISNLKMTKQEQKDEYKETEGSPESKGRIRSMQRKIAMQRMMSKVPQADVVITNPEHYAVALKYDDSASGAPVLIAKGVDLTAFQIRKIAQDNKITIVEAPPLARAIYYSTKLDREIPRGLYVAVAQVLAYVFQLKRYSAGKGPKPKLKDLPIPEDLRR